MSLHCSLPHNIMQIHNNVLCDRPYSIEYSSHLNQIWGISGNIWWSIGKSTKHYYEYEQCYALDKWGKKKKKKPIESWPVITKKRRGNPVHFFWPLITFCSNSQAWNASNSDPILQLDQLPKIEPVVGRLLPLTESVELKVPTIIRQPTYAHTHTPSLSTCCLEL